MACDEREGSGFAGLLAESLREKSTIKVGDQLRKTLDCIVRVSYTLSGRQSEPQRPSDLGRFFVFLDIGPLES